MKKFNFILEITLVILFTIALINNLILGAWLFVALDGACITLGLVNIYLIWRNHKRKETQNVSEDT